MIKLDNDVKAAKILLNIDNIIDNGTAQDLLNYIFGWGDLLPLYSNLRHYSKHDKIMLEETVYRLETCIKKFINSEIDFS